MRTPMPWRSGAGAGFTTGKPWLPFGPDFETRNAEVLKAEPHSILNLYQQLAALRRAAPALALGDIEVLQMNDHLLAYERRWKGERVRIALNFGEKRDWPQVMRGWRSELSTHLDESSRHLRAQEGVICTPETA